MSNLAKALRQNQTETEKKLWLYLRSRQMVGYKFRRQQPIGPYVVDFCCLKKRLILELDGGQHTSQIEADKRRTQFLEKEGFRVIRFWDNEIFQNREGVLEKIVEFINHPHPALSPQGRGKEKKGSKEEKVPPVLPSPLAGEGRVRGK